MGKILKWCGFEYDTTQTGGYVHDFGWRNPDGSCIIGLEWDELPPLDMNFFFKYVAPRVRLLPYKKYVEFMQCLVAPVNHVGDYDPDKTWQDAVIKLIEEG